ncbi:hypothetical protein EKO27_g10866 [Xylaria grammica]|uniref:RING-type domain-containing protein n=1 Tax=Xylaria grammica TaxID=363999 RepID=A0A439CQ03_9PEZI|nr:hypothetical protein EKO27_g10866 [Xylaria grammica]
MDFSSAQFTTSRPEVVESNNFRHLLSYFDGQGKLREVTTRFDIECQICGENNLAFTNPAFCKPNDRTYEDYTVLPRCGHAFGSGCLQNWLKHYYQRYRCRGNPPLQCPVCRTPIYCDKRHMPRMIKFTSHDADRQAKNIQLIRAELSNRDCLQCQKDGGASGHEEAADRERRRLDERHAAERSQLEQRLAGNQFSINESRDRTTQQSHEFRALLRQEREARTRTQNAWSAANTTLGSLRQPLQYANDRANTRNPNHALYGYNDPIEVDFRRVSGNVRSTADDWRELGSRLANLGPRVQEMINAEVEEAEVARTVNKQLQDIQKLLQQHFSGGPASDDEEDAE